MITMGVLHVLLVQTNKTNWTPIEQWFYLVNLAFFSCSKKNSKKIFSVFPKFMPPILVAS